MTVHEVLTEWAQSRKDFLTKVKMSSCNAETIFSQLDTTYSELKKEISEVCEEHNVGEPNITLSELQKELFFWRQRLTIGEANWQFDYSLPLAKLEECHRCRKFFGKDDEVSGLFVSCWREGWEPAIIRADAYIRVDSQWTPQILNPQGLVPLTKDSAQKFILRVIQVGLEGPNLFWPDIRKRYKDGVPVAELTKETKKLALYMSSPQGMYL